MEKRRKVKQTIAIYASQDGVVSEFPVRDGMYVKPAMKVMTLADLSTVWLIAEVFERQADAVAIGDKAEATLPYLPGKVLEGKVEYIYPSLDPKTRALRARLVFKNPGESLKPNMYAQVKLYANPRKDVLSIPLEALIRAGDKDRVIIEVGQGKFDAKTVVTGVESGDRIEIIKGLKPSDIVVTSGQFLLDSEASLKASFTRMSDPQEDIENTPADTPMDKPVSGQGTVLGIDAETHQINLAHDAIPALGWPGMTMVFQLDDRVDTGALKSGDAVSFDLKKQGDHYVVVAIRPLKAEQ